MRFLFFLALFLFPFWTFAQFETQWFTQYTPSPTWAYFECEEMCFIVLGKAWWDTMDLKLRLSGNGIAGYGHIIDNQIHWAWSMNIDAENFFISPPWSLWFDPNFLKKKPFPLVLIFQWKIKGDLLSVSFKNTSFWDEDPFKPFTINLLYGPRIGPNNVNSIFYIVFLFWAIMIYVISRNKNRWLYVLIFGLSLWCIYDIRMSKEVLLNYTQDISAVFWWQEFRDRDDFYRFIDFAHKNLEKNNIKEFTKISSYSNTFYWYVPSSLKYFLYPYHIVQNKPSDIIISYRAPHFSINSQGIYNSGIFLGTGTMESFSPDSFIFYFKK